MHPLSHFVVCVRNSSSSSSFSCSFFFFITAPCFCFVMFLLLMVCFFYLCAHIQFSVWNSLSFSGRHFEKKRNWIEGIFQWKHFHNFHSQMLMTFLQYPFPLLRPFFLFFFSLKNQPKRNGKHAIRGSLWTMVHYRNKKQTKNRTNGMKWKEKRYQNKMKQKKYKKIKSWKKVAWNKELIANNFQH